MARYLNVNEDEVMFGPSTSQNTYVLAQGFLKKMQPGDAVIISAQEHEANTGAWHRLAEHGMDVRVWPIDPDSGGSPLMICGRCSMKRCISSP